MLHEMKKERKKGKKERFDFKYRFESISCEIKIPEENLSVSEMGDEQIAGRSLHKKMLFAGLSSFSWRSAVSRFFSSGF